MRRRSTARTEPWAVVALAFVIIIAALSQPASAVEFETQISGSSKFILYSILDRFAFFSNGTWELEIKPTDVPPSSQVYWLLCTQTEYFTDNFGFGATEPECPSSPDDLPKWCGVVVGPIRAEGPLNFNGTIDSKDMYYQAVINCLETPVDITYTLTCRNPGGEELGFDQIPLGSMFIVLSICWSIISIAWCSNWWYHRKQKSWLHRVVSVFPVVKLAWSIFAVIYWQTKSEHGTVPRELWLGYTLLGVAVNSSFYGILLLVSSGWQIVDHNIGLPRNTIIGGCVSAVAVSMVLSVVLNPLFGLLTFAAMIVIVVMILRFTNRNLLALESARDLYPPVAVSWTPRELSAYRVLHMQKLKLFRNFKVVMLSSIGLMMLIFLMSVLFLTNFQWVQELMYEVLELETFGTVLVSLRLRAVNLYFMIDSEDERENDSGSGVDTAMELEIQRQQQVSAREVVALSEDLSSFSHSGSTSSSSSAD